MKDSRYSVSNVQYEPKTITISMERYQELVEDAIALEKLYAAGVNNWEGYEFAFEEDD
jgi:hypothetical protein